MYYLGLAANITSCTVNTLEIKHVKETISQCNVGFLHFVIGSFLMASQSSKPTKLHGKSHHKT